MRRDDGDTCFLTTFDGGDILRDDASNDARRGDPFIDDDAPMILLLMPMAVVIRMPLVLQTRKVVFPVLSKPRWELKATTI